MTARKIESNFHYKEEKNSRDAIRCRTLCFRGRHKTIVLTWQHAIRHFFVAEVTGNHGECVSGDGGQEMI